MLVADIESYPDYIPGCNGASFSYPSAEILDCGLPASVQGCLLLRQAWRDYQLCTRNKHLPYERIQMQLVSGPLRSLSGYWSFTELGAHRCSLACSLEVEVIGSILDRPLSRKLNALFADMLSAFVQQADRLYPPSS